MKRSPLVDIQASLCGEERLKDMEEMKEYCEEEKGR